MSMTNQLHHREELRKRIMQSALKLFNRHGFTAARAAYTPQIGW
jgi:AcrR family transcriptional regulator